MTATTTHAAEWAAALDEHLLDSDTLGDWLSGHLCFHNDVSAEAVGKLGRDLAMGRGLQATPPWTVRELLYVVLSDPDPAVVIEARAELRNRLLAEHSVAVARLYWAAQDAEREASAIELDDDSPIDIGCEFDA